MNIRICYIILASLLSCLAFQKPTIEIYTGQGTVSFVSEAPLEIIKATSTELKGIIDLQNKTFAFTFQVNTFEGFNSPLQKEHFNEHYLETALFPKSNFIGNIIGWDDCKDNCTQSIYAKGKLSIHGITQVVNIPIEISFSPVDKTINAETDFSVELKDFDIHIPLILEAKIARTIQINVQVEFKKSDEQQ